MRNNKKLGFTVVELIVVVIVLSLLVGGASMFYTETQKDARSDKAEANAEIVKKAADAFYAETGRMPGTTSEFSTYKTKVPTTITLITNSTTLSATNGETSVDYDIVGTAAAASGARIRYWDFAKSGGADVASRVIYIGDATSGSTFVDLAS